MTVFGAASVVGIVGTSACPIPLIWFDVDFVIAVYVCLTAYGAWAVEKFIGREYVAPFILILDLHLTGCSKKY